VSSSAWSRQCREDPGPLPKKGALAVGSDADVVLLDPKCKRVLTAAQLHESDYTPWEGHEVGAWPSLTMLRGKVVVEDEKFTGALSDGSGRSARWRRRYGRGRRCEGRRGQRSGRTSNGRTSGIHRHRRRRDH